MSNVIPFGEASTAPAPRQGRGAGAAKRTARLAVIGGGFAGALTAIHLLWRCRRGERVYLVERRSRIGPGLAFSTLNSDHLLNVRASNASAFGDEPNHFSRWLERLPAEERGSAGLQTEAGVFARRSVYGRYIQELLQDAILRQGGAENLFIVADECTGLRAHGDTIRLDTAMGRVHEVDAAILATGIGPPDSRNDEGYVGNPWNPRAMKALRPDAPVLLIGTGLTMIDIVLALRGTGFSGPIIAISRRGLLPRAHAATDAWPPARLRIADRRSLVSLTRAVRAEIDRAARRGGDWRAVVDALRPRLGALWAELPAAEQARFLRHLRPWWDVHRHRMAPPVDAAIAAELAAGSLTIAAGRIESVAPAHGQIEVAWRRRGSDLLEALQVQRAINCTGLGTDPEQSEEGLLRQLLMDGLVRPDPHRLGVATTRAGLVVGAHGRPTAPIFAVGPITRGMFWETTSIPDIRNQVENVAIAALRAARGLTRPERPRAA